MSLFMLDVITIQKPAEEVSVILTDNDSLAMEKFYRFKIRICPGDCLWCRKKQ